MVLDLGGGTCSHMIGRNAFTPPCWQWSLAAICGPGPRGEDRLGASAGAESHRNQMVPMEPLGKGSLSPASQPSPPPIAEYAKRTCLEDMPESPAAASTVSASAVSCLTRPQRVTSSLSGGEQRAPRTRTGTRLVGWPNPLDFGSVWDVALQPLLLCAPDGAKKLECASGEVRSGGRSWSCPAGCGGGQQRPSLAGGEGGSSAVALAGLQGLLLQKYRPSSLFANPRSFRLPASHLFAAAPGSPGRASCAIACFPGEIPSLLPTPRPCSHDRLRSMAREAASDPPLPSAAAATSGGGQGSIASQSPTRFHNCAGGDDKCGRDGESFVPTHCFLCLQPRPRPSRCRLFHDDVLPPRSSPTPLGRRRLERMLTTFASPPAQYYSWTKGRQIAGRVRTSVSKNGGDALSNAAIPPERTTDERLCLTPSQWHPPRCPTRAGPRSSIHPASPLHHRLGACTNIVVHYLAARPRAAGSVCHHSMSTEIYPRCFMPGRIRAQVAGCLRLGEPRATALTLTLAR